MWIKHLGRKFLEAETKIRGFGMKTTIPYHVWQPATKFASFIIPRRWNPPRQERPPRFLQWIPVTADFLRVDTLVWPGWWGSKCRVRTICTLKSDDRLLETDMDHRNRQVFTRHLSIISNDRYNTTVNHTKIADLERCLFLYTASVCMWRVWNKHVLCLTGVKQNWTQRMIWKSAIYRQCYPLGRFKTSLYMLIYPFGKF